MVGLAWTPAQLFAGGAAGAWYSPSPTTCYQDTGQTTPADYTDTVAAVVASYGTADPMLQSTVAAEPQLTATPARLVFDKIDDNMSIDFTGSGGFTATLIQASKEGTFSATVAIPDGPWSLAKNAAYFPSNNIVGLALVEGVLSDADIQRVRNTFINQGAGDNYSTVTNMDSWFRARNDLITLDVSSWNTSSVTNFRYFIHGCSSLTTLNVSNWDTSSVTNFSVFVSGCSNLTTFNVSNWDTGNVSDFRYFAFGCSNLTTLDVSNWNTNKATIFESFANGCASLTTITVNGGTGSPFSDSPCINYTNAFTNTNLTQQSIDDILVAIEAAGTSGGTFNQSGGSAPSVTGQVAITALRLRGWTVTVTGGF